MLFNEIQEQHLFDTKMCTNAEDDRKKLDSQPKTHCSVICGMDVVEAMTSLSPHGRLWNSGGCDQGQESKAASACPDFAVSLAACISSVIVISTEF